MKVFLSYGHDSYEHIILDIQKRLENKGFEIWLDKDKLVSGSDWESRIENAIQENEMFIFCITPHSVRRPDGYCLNEISYAVMLKKDIIPIMIDDSGAYPPISVCRLQWLDLLNIHKLDKVQYEVKLSDIVENLVKILKKEASLGLAQRYTSLSQILNPEDFSLDIEKHTKRFIGREWLIEDIKQWSHDLESSRILWISAGAGYGKSALSANLTHKIENVVGVFFCQYNQEKRQNAKNFLSTIAYQLSVYIKDYKIILDSFSEEDFKLYSLNNYDFLNKVILEPLNKIQLEGVYILIIDALDEAYNSQGNNEVVELIANEFMKFPKNIKFLITSRAEADIKQQLAHISTLEFSPQREENRRDLVRYAREYIDDKKLTIQQIEEIVLRSEGNILYLQEVVKDLNSGELNINNIDEFPKGLSGTYYRYFKRKFIDIDEYEEKYMGILELLISANAPVNKSLMIDILKIKKREFKKLLTRFGTLIEEHNDKLFFYHKSIVDWLINEEYCSDDYWIDIEEGEEKFYDYFIEDFENENYTENLITFFPFAKVSVEHKLYYKSLQTIANIFLEKKDYDNAEKFAYLLLQNMIREKGKENQETLAQMMKYIDIILLKADFNKAEKLLKDLIEVKNKVLGAENISTLASMEKLAYVFRRKGKYNLAAQYYEKILDNKDDSSHEYFSIAKEYALVLVYLSNFAKANRVLEKSLGYFRDLDTVKNNLLPLAKVENFTCFNLRFLNRHNDAVKHIRRAIEIQEKYQDELDVKIDLAASYNNYATTCIEMHNLETAEQYIQKSLKIRNELFSSDKHPDILVSRTSQGIYFYKKGEYETSYEILSDVLQKRKKIYEPKHSYISRSMRDLAKCLLKMQEYDKAEKLFFETLSLREDSFGYEHPVVANIYYDIAKLYYVQNNLELSKKYLSNALNIYMNLFNINRDDWYYFVYKILLVKQYIFNDTELFYLLHEITEKYPNSLRDDLCQDESAYFDFEFKY